MGHNFYFAFMVAGPVATGGLGYSWEVALGANCVAGVAFLVLSLVGIRGAPDRRDPALPAARDLGGIGLLIAFVGFEWRESCARRPARSWRLATCTARRRCSRSAARSSRPLCWRAATAPRSSSAPLRPAPSPPRSASYRITGSSPRRRRSRRRSRGSTSRRRFRPDLVAVIFVLFFLGLFDTVGTLIGVADQAG